MPPDEPAGRPSLQGAPPDSPRSRLARRRRIPAAGTPGGLAPRADSEGKALTIPRSISFWTLRPNARRSRPLRGPRYGLRRRKPEPSDICRMLNKWAALKPIRQLCTTII